MDTFLVSAESGLEEVAAKRWHIINRAFTEKDGNDKVLDSGGDYQWRNDGEEHLFNPQTIHTVAACSSYRGLPSCIKSIPNWFKARMINC